MGHPHISPSISSGGSDRGHFGQNEEVESPRDVDHTRLDTTAVESHRSKYVEEKRSTFHATQGGMNGKEENQPRSESATT